MIRIEFTEQQVEDLSYERYHHPHPQVQQKMEVLYLKSQGLPHHTIRKLCQISKTTLTVYLRQYLEGGIPRLKQSDSPVFSMPMLKPLKLISQRIHPKRLGKLRQKFMR